MKKSELRKIIKEEIIKEGTFKTGIWIIWYGMAGELDREFVEKKSDIAKIVKKWSTNLNVGDSIKIEKGESEF